MDKEELSGKKLFVVGIGPGEQDQMTIKAYQCLESCSVIVGYTVYIALLGERFHDKKLLSTPMKKELERCELAFAEARKGERVAMICSGDAGVYGMAGPILELAEHYPEVTVEVIAGVTAASSGAAMLGAPLTHDFAVISLSDLLTPWETIARRLECAARGDFAISIYNPSSTKRSDYLEKACDILLRYKSPDTVCGIAWQIGREGQQSKILTLDLLKKEKLTMFSTVFVGNSQTKKIGEMMVTPRGYHTK